MAINFANYLGQSYKPDLSGIGDLVENLGKGYSIGRMPDTMREEQEGRMRDNALKQIQQQFQPQVYKSQLQKARMEYDPQAKADYIKHLISAFGGESGGGGNGMMGGVSQDEFKNALIRQALGIPAQLPQEKLDMESQKIQQRDDLKKKRELEAAIQELRKGGRDIQGVEDILNKPGEATGYPGQFKSAVSKFTGGKYFPEASGDLANVNERLVRMQASLARLISSRGGAVAAQLAASGKPSAWESKAHNLGMTKAMKEGLKSDYDDLSRQYEQITGEKPSFSLDDIFHDAVQKASSEPAQAGTPLASRRESVGNDIRYNKPIKVPASVDTQAKFKAYLRTLTPKEREELQRQYLEVR
jgi:hypothetical protein